MRKFNKIVVFLLATNTMILPSISKATGVLSQQNIKNSSLQKSYNSFEKKLESRFQSTIDKLSGSDLSTIRELSSKLSNLFLKLDLEVAAKDRSSASYTIGNIRKAASEIISSLNKIEAKLKTQSSNQINITEQSSQLNDFSKTLESANLTYYADYFEGKGTASGDKFYHSVFSAAKCETSLNTLIQVFSGEKSVIVKVNDRPNCDRFPDIIDLSLSAFDVLSSRGSGKVPGNYISLGKVPSSYYKNYLPVDSFSEASILLDNKLPNTYLPGETMNINGELTLPNREISFTLTDPKGVQLTLNKDVDKYFSFSFPMGYEGTYILSTDGSDQKIYIYVLPDSSYFGKTFKSFEMNQISKPNITKELIGKGIYAYRISIPGNNYNMATLVQDGKKLYYSGIGDIVIPENALTDNTKAFDLNIKSAKTSTNFSHDFYTEPFVIFSGTTIMPQ